jgi:hypothetical protein
MFNGFDYLAFVRMGPEFQLQNYEGKDLAHKHQKRKHRKYVYFFYSAKEQTLKFNTKLKAGQTRNPISTSEADYYFKGNVLTLNLKPQQVVILEGVNLAK